MWILIHSLTSLGVNVDVNFVVPRPHWAGGASLFCPQPQTNVCRKDR
jgi:hypothetical protein